MNNLFLFGVIIFIVGLCVFKEKLYYKLLDIFLFLPALFIIATNYKFLLDTFKKTPSLWIFTALIMWATISLTWSTNTEETKAIKRLLYITIFTLSCLISLYRNAKQFENILFISSLLLSFCALISMASFPWRVLDIPDRMSSFNQLTNPIIASYTMGIAFIVIHLSPNHNATYLKIIRYLALFTLTVFIIWSKSRGAIGSLIIYLLFIPLLSKQKINHYWIKLILLIGIAGVLFFFHNLITERGLSFRPHILLKSIEMIMEHPLIGLGLRTPYEIPFNGELSFFHTHNLFLHIGIVLGIVGLFIYSILWLKIGWTAWQNSNSSLGNILLGVFIFSSVALQFDGVILWEKPNPIWLTSWLPIVIGLYLTIKNNKSIFLIKKTTH